jgi:hypothetical protein
MSLGRPARVFLSYSHRDTGFLQDFLDNLATLEFEKLIAAPWWDGDIDAGGKWRSEISTNLEQADLIVLLLSPRFVASKFCTEVELPRSRDLAVAGRTVVPVILDAGVNLGALGLAELQAVPDPQKPVSRYRNHTEAFAIVVDKLRRLLSRAPDADGGAAGAGRHEALPIPAPGPNLDFLPHLCDRKPQIMSLTSKLACITDEPLRPVVIIVPGDGEECHSEFVDRLQHIELPDRLAQGQAEAITRRQLNDLRHLPDVQYLWRELYDEWRPSGEGASNRLEVISEHVRQCVATHERHLLFVSDFYSRDFDRVKRVLPLILEFWSTQWRGVKLKRAPFHCLCLQYDRADRALPVRERRELGRRTRELEGLVQGLDPAAYPEIHCIKLDPLSTVEWSDVRYWRTDRHVMQRCSIPEDSIKALESELRVTRPMRQLAPLLAQLARKFETH